MSAPITVEVAYATPERQWLVTLEVAAGSSARAVALAADASHHFPAVDVATAVLGIFGERLSDAASREVKAGERIEIYRPLVLDPKARRRAKAKRSAASTAK